MSHRRIPKAVAAANHLREVNSAVEIEPVVADITHRNIVELAQGVDLIVDGTDNFETRLLLNDYAVSSDTPWIYGGVIGAEGRVMPIIPGKTACFACLTPEAPAPGELPTCDTAGVLGPAVGVVASLQAMEAIKYLSGAHDSLIDGLLVIDLWNNRWHTLKIKPVEGCRCCVLRRFDWLEGRQGSATTKLCGRGAVQLTPPEGSPRVDLKAMRAKLAPLGELQGNEFLLRLLLPKESGSGTHEVTLFADGRAIIGGVDDEAQARGVWARCLGG